MQRVGWSILLSLWAAEAGADVEALLRCRIVPNTEARALCYDAAVDAMVLERQRDAATGDSIRAVSPSGSSESPVEEIRAGIVGLTADARGKWVIELDNGQAWLQTDSERSLMLARGEQVLIRKAGLGSFRLEKAGGSRGVRVKRLD